MPLTGANGLDEFEVADSELLGRCAEFLVLGRIIDLFWGEMEGIAFVALEEMAFLLPTFLVDRGFDQTAAVAAEQQVMAMRRLDLVLEAFGSHLDGGVEREEASATRDYAWSIFELGEVEGAGGGEDCRGSLSDTWLRGESMRGGVREESDGTHHGCCWGGLGRIWVRYCLAARARITPLQSPALPHSHAAARELRTGGAEYRAVVAGVAGQTLAEHGSAGLGALSCRRRHFEDVWWW